MDTDFWIQIFEILRIHVNLPGDHVRSYKTFGSDWFSRFDVYWIQTDKQTNRQTDKQTNRQTDKQTNIQTDKQKGKVII